MRTDDTNYGGIEKFIIGGLMGLYRLSITLFAVVLVAGCAAFDNGNEPFAGFSKDEIPPPPGSKATGIYTGYYKGDAVVESNTCKASIEKAGSKVSLDMDVTHQDTNLNIVINSGDPVAGTLDGTKSTVMSEAAGVRHVYYLEFADTKITGSSEVIEKDDAGQYGDPCESYTFTLAKTEKPAAK